MATVVNITQIFPLAKNIIIKEDVTYLSPIRTPLNVLALVTYEITPLDDHSNNLREKSQRFKVIAKQFFSEALACLQPLKDTTRVALFVRDWGMDLLNWVVEEK